MNLLEMIMLGLAFAASGAILPDHWFAGSICFLSTLFFSFVVVVKAEKEGQKN